MVWISNSTSIDNLGGESAIPPTTPDTSSAHFLRGHRPVKPNAVELRNTLGKPGWNFTFGRCRRPGKDVVAWAAARQVVAAAPVDGVAAAEPEDRIPCLGTDQDVGAVVAGDDVEALGMQVGGAGGAGSGAGDCTVSVNCREATGTFGLGSAAVTVNVNVPFVVGVPEISPLSGSRLRPGGAGSRQ
ncbi:hypothetical protein [Streptomyces mirabilis]|uniref:hypothetical protein n=1 Tax=Streptomyces mirabilis TaxID=68239 RepID=UPI0024C38C23|nr:hypothetical protein [Streptomyces mirabilis]